MPTDVEVPQRLQALKEWLGKRPDLPKIDGNTLDMFLRRSRGNDEIAKQRIARYFAIRRLCPELFQDLDPENPATRRAMEVSCCLPLPKATPQGHGVFLLRFFDFRAKSFQFKPLLEYYDLVFTDYVGGSDAAEDVVVVVDQMGSGLEHVLKVELALARKFAIYLQTGLPLRVKGIHVINAIPHVDKLLAIVKQMVKTKIMRLLCFHESLDSLHKYVPKECLPEDYGGTLENSSELHDQHKKRLLASSDFYLQKRLEMKALADKTPAHGDLQGHEDIFGTEGTFKKLDID